MNRKNLFFGMAIIVAIVSGACEIADVSPPPLMGPSELAVSLTLSATPDLVPENGASQSVISVIARDQNGQPIRNLELRVDVVSATDQDTIITNRGILSTNTIITDSSGQASLVYTAPLSAAPGVDQNEVVVIRMRPSARDFESVMPRFVNVRLIPETVVIVPGAPIPSFTFSPVSPSVGTVVLFNASASSDSDGGTIVSYRWDWGDGASATRTFPSEDHDFPAPGTYNVKLTVTDNEGKQSFTVRPVVVN